MLARSSWLSRRLVRGSLAVAASSLIGLAVEPSALAYDQLAVPCAAEPWYCETAPIRFDHTDALPIEFQFDTGWVPANSPLQVHVWAGLYAHTRVSVKGALETSWPESLTLETPGDKNGGGLAFRYGMETGAEAKLDVEVLGQKYTWTGDIPYIPQIDFQVDAQESFDAWAFDPGKTVSAKTAPQKVANVGLGSIIGGSIPGIDGGFELDVAVELAVTYTTVRMVLQTTAGLPVSGGDILYADGKSSAFYGGGSNIEFDVHPEGTLDYDGVLHLIPAFYIKLLGKSWNIPIADIPIGFPITKVDVPFDAQRVRVPLPDLVVPEDALEFGAVEIGQAKFLDYPLFNAGEAGAIVALTSSAPVIFEAATDDLTIEANDATDSTIRFAPMQPGEFTATIYAVSNDPSDPVQTFLVHGTAYDGSAQASVEDAPIPPSDPPGDTGGCACRAAGDAPTSTAPLALASALGLAAAARRRKKHA
jgi:MYXO-CTERM domain-containing protein